MIDINVMLFYIRKPLYAAWPLPISYARQRPLSKAGRERTWRLGMGTADGAMGGSYGAREFGAGDWAGALFVSPGAPEIVTRDRYGPEDAPSFEVVAPDLRKTNARRG